MLADYEGFLYSDVSKLYALILKGSHVTLGEWEYATKWKDKIYHIIATGKADLAAEWFRTQASGNDLATERDRQKLFLDVAFKLYSPKTSIPGSVKLNYTSHQEREIDYKKEFLKISNILVEQFPECEITSLDMVKLLVHENNTLRAALNMPTLSHSVKILSKINDD